MSSDLREEPEDAHKIVPDSVTPKPDDPRMAKEGLPRLGRKRGTYSISGRSHQ
jgi:hypothetical protein